MLQCLVCRLYTVNTMKYKVTICRTGYSFNTFEVEAEGKWQANIKATELAADAEWHNESEANYDVEEIREIK